MDQQYITPFIDSAREMLSTMLGIASEPCEPPLVTGDSISGTIFFQGESNGQVTLSFSRSTAVHIVSEMVGMDEAEMDGDTLRDGVGEMANIVAGNVKASLASTPYKFLLSLPEIHAGDVALPPNVDKVERGIRCDLGEFSITFWLALAS